ncbi:hypothetical protein LINGRAHAP2_LOCUS4300 [Linum grandiflorum]
MAWPLFKSTTSAVRITVAGEIHGRNLLPVRAFEIVSLFTVKIVMFLGCAGSSSNTTIRLSLGFKYDLGMWYLHLKFSTPVGELM